MRLIIAGGKKKPNSGKKKPNGSKKKPNGGIFPMIPAGSIFGIVG